MKLTGIWILLSGLLVAACAALPTDSPLVTLLDEKSAVTIETMSEPYVLAHEVTTLSANARDYLDLRLVAVDRAGNWSFLLSLVAFTTVDRRGVADPITRELFKGVTVLVDGKRFVLQPLAEESDLRGISQRLFARRNGELASAEYVLTPELIAALVTGQDLQCLVGSGEDFSYLSWMPSLPGVNAFAKHWAAYRH